MSNVPPSSPTPSPAGDDADLLASLYLDGEATDEERARVDADPQLLALVETFRSTATDLALVTPPSGLGAQQINAALDLFDQQPRMATIAPLAGAHSVAVSETDTPPTVSSLADRRARRSSGLPSWIGAAAIAALVVGGIGFATTLGGDDADESAAESAETSLSASATNRDADTAAVVEDAASGDAEMATEAVEADDSLQEEAPQEEAMEEAAEEEAVEETSSSESDGVAAAPAVEDPAAFYAERGPINLENYDAGTATQYFDQLVDAFPLQPIIEAPCAESPLLDGLFGVDSFYPVIFDGQLASLIVRSDAPWTALIVGPACEIAHR